MTTLLDALMLVPDPRRKQGCRYSFTGCGGHVRCPLARRNRAVAPGTGLGSLLILLLVLAALSAGEGRSAPAERSGPVAVFPATRPALTGSAADPSPRWRGVETP